jgi:hypothetical protein
MCGVGKFMKIWKERDVAACPQCGNFEDASHVWLCKETGAEEMWGSALDKVREWIESVNTNQDIHHIILTYLQSWRNGLIPNSHHPISIQEPIQDIIDQQQDIRWQSVFTGWTTAEWECLQPAYYAAICS